ncbi:hypothetical protein [Streptomyces sp. NPDC059176]|uniref:hypothetical protein n=1 Tax=Streptomyces sp. NPDC059176 TaxID=3346758 RepID=UPI003675F5AB
MSCGRSVGLGDATRCRGTHDSWAPPRPERSEGLVFIYDGGRLTAEQLATIQLQPEELRAYEFVPLPHIADRLIPLLARRVHHSAHARTHHPLPRKRHAPGLTLRLPETSSTQVRAYLRAVLARLAITPA